MALDISKEIAKLTPSQCSGSLRIWGVWFGRPMDGSHICISISVENEALKLSFKEGETLIISAPGRPHASRNGFEVRSASRVRWEWYSYGRPLIAENLFFEDYSLEQGKIVRESNYPKQMGRSDFVDKGLPAVSLLREPVKFSLWTRLRLFAAGVAPEKRN